MEESKTLPKAYIYSKEAPLASQKERFDAFLLKNYGKEFDLTWVFDEALDKGFKLVAAGDVYDWTPEGRYRQLAAMLEELAVSDSDDPDDDIITLFKTSIDKWEAKVSPEEEGRVLTVGDGIVIADGPANAVYGEIVIFESGVKGMVQDLRPDSVGIILFGDDSSVREGNLVRRTKKTAGVPVGEGFLGRVVNALGEPVDGQGKIKADGYRAVESPAPDIISRQAVNTPMNTGILSIDSMFPIGRGQRELIIGDRQTGKTTIATDTILNQKGNGVICIYVAIGQKASSIAHLVNDLKKKGAMDYTIVVAATASEAAPIQYIAP